MKGLKSMAPPVECKRNNGLSEVWRHRRVSVRARARF